MISHNTRDLVPGRIEKIADIVQRQRMVRVAELCEATGVSPATIRRDLAEMEARGLLRKVHGGAVSAERRREEPFFDDKTVIAAAEKQRIARAALAFIGPRDTVFLDGGSTVLSLAALLHGMPRLTVVTNSLRVAMALPDAGPRVIVVGGELRARSQTFVGTLTEPVLSGLHVDTAFMGTIGLSAAEGLTTTDPREAFTKQLVMRHARRVVLLADSHKHGDVSFVGFGDLATLDVLITDKGASQALCRKIRKQGVKVITT